MNATNYKQDYIVTWTAEEYGEDIQEGFTYQELKKYKGKSDLDKIKQMYNEFNQTKITKRQILKIEKIIRKIIFEL